MADSISSASRVRPRSWAALPGSDRRCALWPALALALMLSGCATTTPDALQPLLRPSGLPAAVARQAPPIDPPALEREIHRLVNEVRLAHGLHALDWSDRLAGVARAHSQDMARHGYFSHLSPTGADPAARAAAAGLPTLTRSADGWSNGLGENIFLTHRFDAYVVHHDRPEASRYEVDWKSPHEVAREAVAAWMQSPAHRANILYPAYTTAAVGVVPGPHETVFITQNFSCRSLQASLLPPAGNRPDTRPGAR
ncbi:MAG: CAP domain-containing protein [Bacteroidetes bacterium]|nr:MAG: CAP domain-containing protein [Bacteroidota bacterium]